MLVVRLEVGAGTGNSAAEGEEAAEEEEEAMVVSWLSVRECKAESREEDAMFAMDLEEEQKKGSKWLVRVALSTFSALGRAHILSPLALSLAATQDCDWRKERKRLPFVGSSWEEFQMASPLIHENKGKKVVHVSES